MTIAILSTTNLPKFLGDDHPDEDSLFADAAGLVADAALELITAQGTPRV